MKCAAAYVLAGGRSSRMGSDKASLPFGSGTLLDRVATEARAATGSVAIVGGPDRPPYRVVPDAAPNAGPVAGIAAALRDSTAAWTLILACDLPGVTRDWLRSLVSAAAGDVTAALGPDGRLHPLCSVWNRISLTVVERALDEGVLAARDVLGRLDCRVFAADDRFTVNINTPDDWRRFGVGE